MILCYTFSSALSTFTQMATIFPEVCRCLIQRQIAYITYASHGIVSFQYTPTIGEARRVASLPNGKRIGGVCPHSPRHPPHSSTCEMPSEGLNEYRASTFGTRCCKIIDPFDLLCPPWLRHSADIYIHMSTSRVSAWKLPARAKDRESRERNLGWNHPIPMNFARETNFRRESCP